MKIIILNGSPRPCGNTHTALKIMQSVLEENHTVELQDLCKMDLSGCLACDGCKHNGGHCIQPDASDDVIQKIVQADAVIFGTPVYWWGMSAQLKMVIDKFYSQDAAFKMMKKKIGVVAVGANEVNNPQYRLIHEQFACIAEYLHWELAFSLSFSAYKPGEILENPTLNTKLQEATKKI